MPFPMSRGPGTALGWFATAVVLAGARCAPADDATCADLTELCPDLICVDPARDSQGCPVCECEVQSCLQASDCASRSPPQRCNLDIEVCEPPPACTDGDDDTLCPAACFGRCEDSDPNEAFCDNDGDCGDGFCRFDNRFCVVDEGRCRGWCVRGDCDAVVTAATDPQSQLCFQFSDSCVPPTFTQGCN